ncbi:MAG: BrnA antitoxin family protein [Rhodocyclaceae bacterium]|nr:BrnA antitoxin family protein [Rhodocyclaceae bacterium]
MSQITTLLRAIAANPGATIEEVAEATGMEPNKARNQIHQAKHKGWTARNLDEVTRQPGYHLTAAGKEKLGTGGKSETKPNKPDPKAAKVGTPPSDTETIQEKRRGRPKGQKKELITIRIDKDLAAWLRSTGRGWQTRVGQALKNWASDQQSESMPDKTTHHGRTYVRVDPELEKFCDDQNITREGLLHFINEIRKELGDPYKQIRIFEIAKCIHHKEVERALSESELSEAHNALSQLIPPDWPIDPSDMSTADIIKQLASTIAATRPTATAPDDDAIDVTEAARGYIVTASKRKPRRITRPESARRIALASVRAGAQRADVFALVPVGQARRGAEWNTQ